MNRRTMLQSLAIIGAGAAIPFKDIWAQTAEAIQLFKRPWHRFILGELELTVLTDGHIRMSPVQPNFPNGSIEEEAAVLRKGFRSDTEIDLSMNVLVIKKGKEVIIVDTGTGGSFGPDSGWLLSSLKDAGIATDSITAVVISHGHPDHIGGVLTKDNKPVFTNAQVYISKAEHAFWTSPQPDFSKSKFQNKELLATFIAATKKTLQTLSSRLHLFEDGAALFGCLRLEIAAGHTPGHALTHISSGKETMVHIADLLHSDLLSFPHPEWGFNGDTDFEEAIATRKRVLAKLADNKHKVFGYHLPWPGIGHVRAAGEAWEWVAETYAFPV